MVISATGVASYATLGGGGTVTSVGLALPSLFTVSGSPVVSTGTLTAALATQSANTVFAAPDGSAGAPTFRALSPVDIPALTTAKISNFTTASQALIDASIVSTLRYKGTANASLGTVALAIGTGTFATGDQYRVTVPGNTAFGYQLNVGDFVTYNGATWDKTDNTDPSVLGTTNRVTSTATGDTSYTVDIASNYIGQASITTVGTIAAGTWQGTAIDIARGGTGGTTAATARAALSATGISTISFTSASLVGGLLTATHNLNNQWPSVTIYNDLNKIIYADDVTATSATVSTIDLTTFVVNGTWRAVFVG
jgi:hypothetical protein